MMSMLKKNHLIEKRHVLNQMRSNNMTLQELRFLSIYLSKINARDSSTRIVKFSLDDFRAIMDLGRLNRYSLEKACAGLLRKIVNVPTEKGFVCFQLFKECKVEYDEAGEWFVEIDAHDRSLPLMFDFKRDYFTYQLWNALRLKSTNQLRMYEVLKQHEKMGECVVTIEELKELIGIEKCEYHRFGDFKMRVLDVCQAALLEHTDICFTYQPHGKRGKGGKIISLKFFVEKNESYVDQLNLAMYIENKRSLLRTEVEIWEGSDEYSQNLSDCKTFGSKVPEPISVTFR